MHARTCQFSSGLESPHRSNVPVNGTFKTDQATAASNSAELPSLTHQREPGPQVNHTGRMCEQG